MKDTKGRKVFKLEAVEDVIAAGGKLSVRGILRHRIRYFVMGMSWHRQFCEQGIRVRTKSFWAEAGDRCQTNAWSRMGESPSVA